MPRHQRPFGMSGPAITAGTLAWALALALPGVAWSAPEASKAAPAAASANCPALLNQTFPRLQDEAPQSLCQYTGKVILVVNTASYCGFTGQYKGLEELYARYRDKGLVVLGFPSNDFLQEKGNNKDIADFCENTFGVRFPMFSQSAVRGANASPFYKQLADKAGIAPRWNFHKYLISRSGAVVGSFSSSVEPGSKQLTEALEKQLALVP